MQDIRHAYLCRYLGGVLDFTGELNRYAIAKATIRDINEVKKCRDIAEALMGEFLQVGEPHPIANSIHTLFLGPSCL